MSEEMEENVIAHEKYLTGLFRGKEEGKEEGMEEGIEKGKLEGKLETQTLIVKNLLNKNMTDLEIMEIANISKEELDNIKKEIK